MERLKLHRNLTDYFSEGELRTLCFYMGVDYDDLPGQGKADKARELISYLERRSSIRELVEICSTQRPDVLWNIRSKRSERLSQPSGMAHLSVTR